MEDKNYLDQIERTVSIYQELLKAGNIRAVQFLLSQTSQIEQSRPKPVLRLIKGGKL